MFACCPHSSQKQRSPCQLLSCLVELPHLIDDLLVRSIGLWHELSLASSEQSPCLELFSNKLGGGGGSPLILSSCLCGPIIFIINVGVVYAGNEALTFRSMLLPLGTSSTSRDRGTSKLPSHLRGQGKNGSLLLEEE
jgi:hypothetical protein